MKRNLLAFSCLFSTLNVFSQQDSLLKNFKYRIGTYRAISFNANGGSNYNKLILPSGNDENGSTGGHMGVTYYAVKSTDAILLTELVSIGASYSAGNATGQGKTDKVRTFSTSSSLSVLNKWFSKNKFIELGIAGNGNFYSTKNSPSAITDKQDQYSLQLNTGVGIGRLENVTDMQNAIWLSKALQAANSLTNSLSIMQLGELGRTITRANTTRVLDARKRTQFVLATVDAYLQQQGLIGKTDISYFSNLNDILFFAFNTQRLSGTEKYIRLTPIISGNHQDYVHSGNFSNDYRRTKKSVLLSAGINRYIPTNLVHQNNYGAALTAYYISGNLTQMFINNGGGMNQTKSNSIARRIGGSLFYTHAIYPNTRTVVTFSFMSECGYEQEEAVEGFYGSADLNGSLDYFISYRTRLTCNFGARYDKSQLISFPLSATIGPKDLWLYANAGIQVNL